MSVDSELRRRLHDLADSVPEWDDALPEVLRRAGTPATERRWRWVPGLGVAAAVLAVLLAAGGVVALVRPDRGSGLSSTAAGGMDASSTAAGAGRAPKAPRLSGCGTVPAPSGPLVGRARVTLSVPHQVRAGSSITARISIDAAADGGYLGASPPWVQITAAGNVVGNPLIAYQSLVRGLTEMDRTVTFTSCTAGGSVSQPLPPGLYQLIAVVDYTAERGSGQLVSPPVTVTVR
ncbi:MAG: hypothetical protein ABJB98_06025 [Actinomycetota bacterium]